MFITHSIYVSINSDSLNPDDDAGQNTASYTCPCFDGQADRLLPAILDFCVDFEDIRRTNAERTVVVQPSGDTQEALIYACLFLGAYLILRHGAAFDAVVALFGQDRLGFDVNLLLDDEPSFRTLDCWSALSHAVRLDWISPTTDQEDDEPLVDLAEMLHYARPANGNVHTVIPGKLLLFPTPDDALDAAGADWSDTAGPDGRTARSFSAGFAAALLRDLGVSAVACLGRGSAATAAALARRGIESVDLGLAADGSSLLRGLDALLSLAGGAPGAVAVHAGGGPGGGRGWPGYAGTLVRAAVMSRAGLDEGAAGAWLRMACPWSVRRPALTEAE